jgi:hypothetical protein
MSAHPLGYSGAGANPFSGSSAGREKGRNVNKLVKERKIMRLYRLLCVTSLAVLVVGLATASVASAAVPTFKPSTKNVIDIESGPGTLEATGSKETITCQSDLGKALLEPGGQLDNILITYHECEGKNPSGLTCKAMSLGAPSEGLIVLNALDGELGEVATSEATNGAGIYLLPTSGKNFTTVLGTCIVESQIRGSIAGEISPTGKEELTGKISLVGAGGKMSIKKITTKSGGHEPSLTSFGSAISSDDSSETVHFLSNEVTVS